MAVEVDVDEIQSRIAAYLDQTTTAPSSGGSDWTLRLSFINRRQEHWANSYEWNALRQEAYPRVLGVSQASVALPADFNRIASEVVVWNIGNTDGTVYPIVKRDEIRLYSTTDRYCYVGGNRKSGSYLYFNPGTLASGASITASYFSIATSLATGTDISVIPDPEYLIKGTIADVLQARSDERFPTVEAEATVILRQMIENEVTPQVSQSDLVMSNERRRGFRVGRD